MPSAARLNVSDPPEISEGIRSQLQRTPQDSSLRLVMTSVGEVISAMDKVNILSKSDKLHWDKWIQANRQRINEIDADEIGAIGTWLIKTGVADISKYVDYFIAIDVLSGNFCVDRDEEKSVETLQSIVTHEKIYVIRVESDVDPKS
jgi:hypothetical protein